MENEEYMKVKDYQHQETCKTYIAALEKSKQNTDNVTKAFDGFKQEAGEREKKLNDELLEKNMQLEKLKGEIFSLNRRFEIRAASHSSQQKELMKVNQRLKEKNETLFEDYNDQRGRVEALIIQLDEAEQMIDEKIDEKKSLETVLSQKIIDLQNELKLNTRIAQRQKEKEEVKVELPKAELPKEVIPDLPKEVKPTTEQVIESLIMEGGGTVAESELEKVQGVTFDDSKITKFAFGGTLKLRKRFLSRQYEKIDA